MKARIVKDKDGGSKLRFDPKEDNKKNFVWANFIISNVKFDSEKIRLGVIADWEKITGFSLNNKRGIDKRNIYRNCVLPKLGLHVFNCAFKTKQKLLSEVFL